uniref:Uncharacterized protein n=1 Tax=Glossina brevipalpis TaxID=37001 RepID=A0A1A9WHW0_9MUSC
MATVSASEWEVGGAQNRASIASSHSVTISNLHIAVVQLVTISSATIVLTCGAKRHQRLKEIFDTRSEFIAARFSYTTGNKKYINHPLQSCACFIGDISRWLFILREINHIRQVYDT